MDEHLCFQSSFVLLHSCGNLRINQNTNVLRDCSLNIKREILKHAKCESKAVAAIQISLLSCSRSHIPISMYSLLLLALIGKNIELRAAYSHIPSSLVSFMSVHSPIEEISMCNITLGIAVLDQESEGTLSIDDIVHSTTSI
jgi:hypothetical protein